MRDSETILEKLIHGIQFERLSIQGLLVPRFIFSFLNFKLGTLLKLYTDNSFLIGEVMVLTYIKVFEQKIAHPTKFTG